MLKQWLKAGYLEKEVFHQTRSGAAQGGAASPCLMNMTLDGLESVIKALARDGEHIHYVRYADDWVCTAPTKEILEGKVLPAVTRFLNERGLELSKEKTKITHIKKGFDFLGFNVRKYKDKLLIKPAKVGIKTFLTGIRKVIRKAQSAGQLISTLNPKIQGWANYYRHSVAKETFSYIDANIFKAIWKWAKRRHPKKARSWIKEKYYATVNLRQWCFFSPKTKEKDTQYLKAAANTRIIRHVKIKAAATPYDPQFEEYFFDRAKKRTGRHKDSRAAKITSSLRRA